MGKNQVLFLSQMEENKMAKQVHIRVDDDIYKELKNMIQWIVPNAQKNLMEPILVTVCSNQANARQGKGRTFAES